MLLVIRRALGSAMVLATFLDSRTAHPAPQSFELEPQLGYAGAFTTGLAPYGAFVGLGAHGRPAAHLWLGASLFSFVGASASGDGPNITYRAHDRAYDLAFDATWRFDAAAWFIEPGLEVGASWIVGSTYVTPAQISDRYVVGNVGVVFRLALRVGPIALGLEEATLFVPSNKAAPIERIGAFAALPF